MFFSLNLKKEINLNEEMEEESEQEHEEEEEFFSEMENEEKVTFSPIFFSIKKSVEKWLWFVSNLEIKKVMIIKWNPYSYFFFFLQIVWFCAKNFSICFEFASNGIEKRKKSDFAKWIYRDLWKSKQKTVFFCF